MLAGPSSQLGPRRREINPVAPITALYMAIMLIPSVAIIAANQIQRVGLPITRAALSRAWALAAHSPPKRILYIIHPRIIALPPSAGYRAAGACASALPA